MTKLVAILLTVAAATASTPAIGSERGPGYLGERSNNPEQETYAEIAGDGLARVTAFVGPARIMGDITGDPEKDTVAYQTIQLVPLLAPNQIVTPPAK